MSSDHPKNPTDRAAEILVAAAPDDITTALRTIWRDQVLAFTARGVSADALAKSLLDMGARVGMDVWGPAATAAALNETADNIKDFPDLNSPAGRH
ncbi:hypothetical protein [Aureimonas sp. D3]|uniref:hypothetical protein n=1 Tax=Aureimonas sp. D3 TaxID=1638164 RepID=UPI000783DE6E|nr:hypothetical protein [Aureimonas sp. D3]